MNAYLKSLPRWYRIVFLILFAGYIGLWGMTIHEAGIERARGDEYVMPVGPHDSWSYAQLSTSLMHGQFVQPGQSYETFLVPGYPAFVALVRAVTGSYFAVTFLQILMAFAIAIMTAALGTKVFGRRIALLASILFLLNPLVPSIALYILTDMLFAFLLMLGCSLLVLHADTRP